MNQTQNQTIIFATPAVTDLAGWALAGSRCPYCGEPAGIGTLVFIEQDGEAAHRNCQTDRIIDRRIQLIQNDLEENRRMKRRKK